MDYGRIRRKTDLSPQDVAEMSGVENYPDIEKRGFETKKEKYLLGLLFKRLIFEYGVPMPTKAKCPLCSEKHTILKFYTGNGTLRENCQRCKRLLKNEESRNADVEHRQDSYLGVVQTYKLGV